MTDDDIFKLALYIIAGFVVGFIVHKLVMPLLAKLASKTKLKSDDLIIETIRKWDISWFVALGLFLGLRRIDMDVHYHTWLENGLMIFYIFSATLILARVISGMLRIKATGTDTVIPSSSIIGNIVRGIIYIIGLLIILQSQGISITPILTALGVGGLAVALALQPTLSNLFAGLQIIASGKLNHGDFVKLSTGEDGYIDDITWRSTTIRGDADHTVIVPNSKLADMIVINYYLPDRELSFSVEFGISLRNDLDHVERITKEVISETQKETEGGVSDFEPLVRYYAVGDNRINVRAILRVHEYSQKFPVRHAFIKKLHTRFQQEGIRLAVPLQAIYTINKEDASGSES
ncbi:MAG: mechanosensitive ion channel family protein [Chitinophagaceae bacterium]|nr:mechanosensitive ion channel family protein [Chitinophagaceae bacterium]